MFPPWSRQMRTWIPTTEPPWGSWQFHMPPPEGETPKKYSTKSSYRGKGCYYLFQAYRLLTITPLDKRSTSCNVPRSRDSEGRLQRSQWTLRCLGTRWTGPSHPGPATPRLPRSPGTFLALGRRGWRTWSVTTAIPVRSAGSSWLHVAEKQSEFQREDLPRKCFYEYCNGFGCCGVPATPIFSINSAIYHKYWYCS